MHELRTDNRKRIFIFGKLFLASNKQTKLSQVLFVSTPTTTFYSIFDPDQVVTEFKKHKLIGGAQISPMSIVVILSIWFGYVDRQSQLGARRPFTSPWLLLPAPAAFWSCIAGDWSSLSTADITVQSPYFYTFRAPRNRFRQTGNRFLGSLKGWQIRVLGSSKLSFNQTEITEVWSLINEENPSWVGNLLRTKLFFLAAVAPVA
jgi:hypothetical protein